MLRRRCAGSPDYAALRSAVLPLRNQLKNSVTHWTLERYGGRGWSCEHASTDRAPVISKEPARAVYFAEGEHHDAGSPKGPEALRASLLLHLLFAPKVVIGDSQALNNPTFRALVSDPHGEPLESGDIASLLIEGDLVVARRAGRSFEEVQAGHVDRGVHDVPPLRYARFLDAVANPQEWAWEERAVAEAFKANTAQRLEEAGAGGDSTVAAVRDWILSRDQLLYAELRQYLQEFAPPVRSFVDELAGVEYRMSLPNALQLPTADSATSRSSPLAYLSLDDELQRTPVAEFPCWVLRPDVLAKLPVAAVRHVAELDASREVKAQLGRMEVGVEPDVMQFVGALEELVNNLESAALQFTEGKDTDALIHIRQQATRLRLWKAPAPTVASTLLCLGWEIRVDNAPNLLAVVGQMLVFGWAVQQDVARAREKARRKEREWVSLEERLRAAQIRTTDGVINRILLPSDE